MAGPEHVGSGGFRVDRKRALATLATRRFQDPAVFVDCWLRCAEASGSTSLELGSGRGFSLAFDVPVPGIGGDPWAPLFDPSPKTAAAEELAKGVLACLAAKPKELVVESGGLRLIAATLETARWEPLKGRAGTLLRVVWGSGGGPDWSARVGRERLWLTRARFAGEPAPSAGLGPIAEVRRGRYRLLLLPRAHSTRRSLVHLYRLGVRVESLEADFPAQVWVQANDDAAELSIDLQRVLPGKRRERLLELTRLHVDDLIRAALAPHRALFTSAARSLEAPSLADVWASRHGRALSGKDIGEKFANLSRLKDRDILVLAGWLADWLHAADSPLLEGAPLFFAGEGKTTTLAELRLELEREGVVRWSRRAGAAPVWCPTSSELAWLTRHFGAALREA